MKGKQNIVQYIP